MLNFGFEATAAERAFDAAIGVKKRLRADLLGGRAFDARDDAEDDGFGGVRGLGESLEDEIFHGVPIVLVLVLAIGFAIFLLAIFASLFFVRANRRRGIAGLAE